MRASPDQEALLPRHPATIGLGARPASPGDPAADRGDEARRRADRDGHRVRLSLRPDRRRGGRRRIVLVGDTAAMVVLGHNATTPGGWRRC